MYFIRVISFDQPILQRLSFEQRFSHLLGQIDRDHPLSVSLFEFQQAKIQIHV